MPLDDLQTVTINGQFRGAYRDEPQYAIEGLEEKIGLAELLQYILDNSGLGGGSDNYVTAASLDGDTLTLSRVSGGDVTVDLSSIDTDTDDFIADAELQGNNLVLTLDSGGTVSVDLSSLAGGGGGTSISIYDAGLGFWVKGTAGITVTSDNQGIYDFDIPAGGILESFQKQFTNSGTEYTGGGEVQLNLNWNTAAFNTGAANSLLPAIKLIPGNNQQYEPTSLAVTVAHTSVAGGVSATTIANINGAGTPLRVKGIL
jgi:hypothetical protein